MKTQYKKTVHVTQVFNPAWLGPERTPDVDHYKFKVMKAMNTLDVEIGGVLSQASIQELIDSGFSVQIS